MFFRSHTLLVTCGAVTVLAICATANISITVDKLDASDGLPLAPPHIVVVDVSVDVSADDAYSAIGITAISYSGAALNYATDELGRVIPTAPGTDNRFVTFFSNPQARDADSRFGLDGRVLIAGAHCSGAAARFFPVLIDVAAYHPNWNIGGDGYVMRVALDLSNVVEPAFRVDSPNIVVSEVAPPNSVRLFQTNCPLSDHGVVVESPFTPSVYFDFGVYGIIPEPHTAVLVLAGGTLLLRRNRAGGSDPRLRA